MANAIPVNMDPEAQQPRRKPKVQAAPTVDSNGVPLPADYATVVRDGLGDPRDFGDGDSTNFESQMESAKVADDGKIVTVFHTHNAIRTDY